MAMTAAMLAEANAASSSCLFVVEIAFPGGTKRYSEEGLAQGLNSAGAASLGMYEAKLKNVSGLKRPTSDRAGGLQAAAPSFTILDPDRTLDQIFEGAQAYSVRGSTCTVKLAAANLTSSDWYTYGTWEVDSWSKSSEFAWGIKLRAPDISLRRDIARNTVQDYDWPNAPQESWGKTTPILYGRYGSARWGAGGMNPTIDVDTTNHYQLVCIGRAWAVPNVYKVGTGRLTLTTDYTITYPVVNGRTYTVIDLVADPGTNAITCDAYGYETVGDGTGSLITDPAQMLKHLLVNFAYGDFGESGSGLWAADATAPVNVASFTAASTFFAIHRWRASRYIAGPRTALDEINQWCFDHWAKAYWTESGEIAVKILDPTDTTIFVDSRLIIGNRDQRDGFSLEYDSVNRKSRYIVRYAQDQVSDGGEITNVLEVRNPRITENAPEDVEMLWAEAKAPTLPSSLFGYAANTLENWMRADTLTGKEDNQAVSQWNDESGASRHWVQATGADQPLYRTGRNGINGMPALSFDGTSDHFTNTALLSDVIQAGIFTVWIVFQANAIDTTNANTWQNDALVADTGGFWGCFLHGTSPSVRAFNWDGSDDHADQTITTGVPYLVRMRHASTTLYCSINGGAETSVASGNTTSLVGTLRMGRSSSTNYFSGLIGEFICYSVNILTPDLLDLDEYLMRKWGI